MISILLPTIRPALYRRAFDSLKDAANGVPYEVVIVADFAPTEALPCKWVKRNRRGVVDALNAGMAVAEGEYIFSFNDESQLASNALRALYCAAQTDSMVIWTPRHLPNFNFAYYGLPFAPFPFVHEGLLKMIGGIADPVYKSFYSDPDLSLRAYEIGVPVRVVTDAVIHHHNDHDYAHMQNVSAHCAVDRETFGRRWGHLGPLVDP